MLLIMKQLRIKEKYPCRYGKGVASIKGGGKPGKGNANLEGGGC
jgi:hypothetical protein